MNQYNITYKNFSHSPLRGHRIDAPTAEGALKRWAELYAFTVPLTIQRIGEAEFDSYDVKEIVARNVPARLEYAVKDSV